MHAAAFAALAEATSAPIVAPYHFARFGTVADVGGSRGSLLSAILAANPQVRGMLVDLPDVITGAGPVLAAAGVADRCTVIGGDFFVGVPSGADAYVLKYIIHDWDDTRGGQHPGAVSPGNGARSHVAADRSGPAGAAGGGVHRHGRGRLDLLMLVLTSGGRERTASEFGQLLRAADFELQRAIGTQSPLSIIEAVPCHR